KVLERQRPRIDRRELLDRLPAALARGPPRREPPRGPAAPPPAPAPAGAPRPRSAQTPAGAPAAPAGGAGNGLNAVRSAGKPPARPAVSASRVSFVVSFPVATSARVRWCTTSPTEQSLSRGFQYA